MLLHAAFQPLYKLAWLDNGLDSTYKRCLYTDEGRCNFGLFIYGTDFRIVLVA